MDDFAPGRQFDEVRVRGWRLWICRGMRRHGPPAGTDAAGIVDGVRGPFEVIAASDYAKVVCGRLVFGGRTEQFVVKEYLHRSWLDPIKHLFVPSRARRACLGSALLLEHGTGCPEPLVVGELRLGPVLLRSFFITRLVPDVRDIFSLLTEEWIDPRRRRDRARLRLISALGTTIGRLHAAGICHGDLRPRNILATQSGGDWTFNLLDNERTKRYGRLPERLRLKNLVQVNMIPTGLSRTDRLRFFMAYLNENRGLWNERKRWASRVMTGSVRRMDDKGRRRATGRT